MNPRSSKAKGRRLQNKLRDLLREAFPKLEEDDIERIEDETIIPFA